MDGAGKHFLARPGRALYQDRNIPHGYSPGTLDETAHHTAAMNDVGELWCFGRLGGTTKAKSLVLLSEQVGDEVCRNLERNRSGS